MDQLRRPRAPAANLLSCEPDNEGSWKEQLHRECAKVMRWMKKVLRQIGRWFERFEWQGWTKEATKESRSGRVPMPLPCGRW